MRRVKYLILFAGGSSTQYLSGPHLEFQYCCNEEDNWLWLLSRNGFHTMTKLISSMKNKSLETARLHLESMLPLVQSRLARHQPEVDVRCDHFFYHPSVSGGSVHLQMKLLRDPFERGFEEYNLSMLSEEDFGCDSCRSFSNLNRDSLHLRVSLTQHQSQGEIRCGHCNSYSILNSGSLHLRMSGLNKEQWTNCRYCIV